MRDSPAPQPTRRYRRATYRYGVEQERIARWLDRIESTLDRDPELVKVDVGRGLVTVDGAKRYGVVIAKDGSVDQGATEKLREKMRGGRGDVGLFSFGGTIDEIKARSLDETHLPAPESPHA